MELCVVKRRVLQIYKIGEFLQMKKVSTMDAFSRRTKQTCLLYNKEIPLHDGAIFVIRHNRNLCLADHNQYKLIHVDPINTIPLIPTPQEPASPPAASTMLSGSAQLVPRPVAAVIKSDEFLMVSGSASNHILLLLCITVLCTPDGVLNPFSCVCWTMNTNDWYILRCPWDRY